MDKYLTNYKFKGEVIGSTEMFGRITIFTKLLTPIYHIHSPKKQIKCVVYQKQRRRLISTYGSKLRVWELAARRLIKELGVEGGQLKCICCIWEECVACVGAEHILYVWNISTEELVHKITLPFSCLKLCFHPSARLVLGHAGGIHVYNREWGLLTYTDQSKSHCFYNLISDNEGVIELAFTTTKLWNLFGTEPAIDYDVPKEGALNICKLNKDKFIVCCINGDLHIFNQRIQQVEEKIKIDNYKKSVFGFYPIVALTPNVLVCTNDEHIRIIYLPTKTCYAKERKGRVLVDNLLILL